MRTKTFADFLIEGGSVSFEGTVAELKKVLRPSEYIKWNARGPQSDSTRVNVIMKDYDDFDYFEICSPDGMTDYGSIETKK